MLYIHCVKGACIRSYFGPHFPAFGLNTGRYGVSTRNKSDCGKMQTRITPNTDIFHAVIVPLTISEMSGLAVILIIDSTEFMSYKK